MSRSLRPTLSSLANGWVFLLPGLALPGLGPAAEPWAIITRVCGGYVTVLLTVVGPPLESRMAGAVRDRDQVAFDQARKNALLVGGGVSVIAVSTGLGLAVYASLQTLDVWLVPVAAASILFWGVLIANTVINRVPNFVGRDASRLRWEVARAVLVSGAFLVTDGVGRLLVLGVLLTSFGLLLIPMSRYRSRAQ